MGWLSVTITLNFSGLFEASVPVTVYEKVLLVEDTPVKSMFATIAPVIELETIQL